MQADNADYLNFADCKIFIVYFAERSASDIPQITHIQNSAFCKIHLPETQNISNMQTLHNTQLNHATTF